MQHVDGMAVPEGSDELDLDQRDGWQRVLPGRTARRLQSVAPAEERRSLLRHRSDVVLMAADWVLVTLAVWLGTNQLLPPVEALVFVVILSLGGMYRTRITLSALHDLPRLAGFCVLGVLAVVLLFSAETPLLKAFVEALATAVMLFMSRVFYYAIIRWRRCRDVSARSRTAIVGGGEVAAKLLKSVGDYPDLGIEPVVVVERNPLPLMDNFTLPVEGAGAPLHEVVRRHNVDTVIVAFSYLPDSSMVSPLRECDQLDCEIFVVPRLYEFMHLSVEMDRVHTVPLVRVRRSVHRTWAWRFKRWFDVAFAGLSMLLVLPVLLTTAIAVYFTDRKAPIIFRQVRIGRDGHEFELYKFRSMKPVSSETSDVDWDPDKGDRVGRVGRFIRKTSFDELPQLWNVVRGDMSMVGPRPERPHFVTQFAESVRSYGDRHRVAVGLTGWAAIHGLRGDTSIDDRAMYDNFYIENWSVWLDIKIVVLTVGALIRGTGS